MCLICANVTDIRIKKKSTDRYKKNTGHGIHQGRPCPETLTVYGSSHSRPLQANP